jgi:undecaprenyl-diphosphatase
MNGAVQDWVNGLAGHSGLLDALMRFSAVDLVFLLALVPPLVWFWPAEPARRAANQRLAASAVLAVAVSVGVAWALGHVFSEARPFVSDADTRLLVHHSADNSFPSDHVAFAAAIAGAFLFQRPWVGWLTLAGVVSIAFARVFVGVHWPVDVLASLAFGTAAGVAAARFERLWTRPQRAFSRVFPPLLVSSP